jgi:FkbH-like protein
MSGSESEIREILAAADDGKFVSKIATLRKLEPHRKAWPKAKIRVLRNYTLENLLPLIELECARGRIDAQPTIADFDTFEQEALDTTSETHRQSPDVIVLSLLLDGLLAQQDASFDPKAIFDRVRGVIESLTGRLASTVVVTTFLPPPWAIGGGRALQVTHGIAPRVDRLNRLLSDFAATQSRVRLIDVSQLVSRVGESAAWDMRFWYLSKAPFRNELLGQLAQEVATVARALKGAIRKVLVLDCDNTLWGGVIGEDGIDGIALDPNQAPGSVFYDFQRQVLELKRQGAVLALCSKNNEADVMQALAEHPFCLLRPDAFAAWRINWQDKATNLRELSEALQLGLDSFVFVDDSSIECEWVRASLPMIDVLQAPSTVYEYPAVLKGYRGFDRLSIADEDLRRTEMYQQEARREQSRVAFQNIDDYLRSLQITLEIQPPTAAEVQRIAQLTQKTNQFNLTTRRYGEGAIERFLSDPSYVVLAARVTDRFGDYGLVGVGIARAEGDTATIDTFLMSCRVLGRKVESVMLNRLLTRCRELAAVKRVRGEFVPTAKNSQVADFFDRHGFAAGAHTDEGRKEYTWELGSPLPEIPDFVTVR